MLVEEGEHLAPAIHCLLGPVEWPVPIEDAVAGTVVAVELVHLAVLLELLLAHHHAAAPELDAGVDVLPLAGIDEGVPATRTGAENADLAVVIGLRAHPLYGRLGIANHLGVGNAVVSAHFG